MVVSDPVLLGHVIRCMHSDRIYSPAKVNEERFCIYRGGVTVLKVSGQILRAKRAENFLTPNVLASGGQDIA